MHRTLVLHRIVSEQTVQRFGLTAVEQLTCGCHVHVEIESEEEGVAVPDRIRVWLPPLLAITANSPYWNAADSGFASYRFQAWNRWPTAGPCEVFGSAKAYHAQVREILGSGVPPRRPRLPCLRGPIT
ncbi:glutamate-cysteine ligase family protein [Arthrobacter sp. MDT3-44]